MTHVAAFVRRYLGLARETWPEFKALVFFQAAWAFFVIVVLKLT